MSCMISAIHATHIILTLPFHVKRYVSVTFGFLVFSYLSLHEDAGKRFSLEIR